jgi:Leucine-rich repeat (LRR) protein
VVCPLLFHIEPAKLRQLTTLDLWDNQLTSLPPEIGQLSQLTELNLGGNSLSDAQIRKLRRMLPNCEVRF